MGAAVLMRAPLPPTSADRPARRTAAVKVGDLQSETKSQSARPASRAPIKRVDVPSAAVAEPHAPLVSIAPSGAAGKAIAALTPARDLWAQRADRGGPASRATALDMRTRFSILPLITTSDSSSW